MNKRFIALTISTALVMNSAQMALAQTAVGTQGELTEAQIEKILNATSIKNEKTTQELVQALVEINNLKNSLKEVNIKHDENFFIRNATYLQVILIAASTGSIHLHVKGVDDRKLKLGAAVAALLLKKVITMAKQGTKLDAETLSRTVSETSTEMSTAGLLPAEIVLLQKEMNTLSLSLLESKNALTNLADGTTEAASVADSITLLVATSYLVLHIISPKLAKTTDGALKTLLPKIQQSIEKMVESGKKPIYGAANASSVTDLVGLALSMSSEQTNTMINKTVLGLDKAALSLQSEILKRQ